jgi:hypothetical protein
MADNAEGILKEKLGVLLDEKIREKIAEFGGLLTRRAAVRLLCKENGISLEKRLPLSEARNSRLPFSFLARVDRIFPVQEYSGSRDKSMRIHVSDEGEGATILLWNEQVQDFNAQLSTGDTAECFGAYFRSGEIGISRAGKITKVNGIPKSAVHELKEGACSVEGIARDVSALKSFKGRNGETRQMFSFSICQGNECARAVVWLGAGEEATLPENGDLVLLENAFFRNNEVHLNAFSRLVVKNPADEIQGTLDSVFMEGGDIAFSISGKKLVFHAQDGLALLGINSIPEGVSLQTVAALKSSELAGRRVTYLSKGGKLLKLRVEK